jgi:hypothetical protein
MYFLYENLIDDYTLTAPEYSETYAIENIYDKKLDKIWIGNDTDVDQRIVIDCATATAHQIIAILNHNFVDGVQTVTIEANANDSWGSPSYSEEISIQNLMYYVIDTDAYRYWSILIEDCDLDDPPSIGYLFLGDYLDFQDASKVYPVDYTAVTTSQISDSGALFGYKNNRIFKKFSLSWTALLESDFEDFLTLFEYVQIAVPFVVIWEVDVNYSIIPDCYGYFDTFPNLPEVHDFGMSDLQITFRECR